MNASQTFPKDMPRRFPFKAGRGHSFITMYHNRDGEYDVFKLPYKDRADLDERGKPKRKIFRSSDYAKARDKGNKMIDQHASGDAWAMTLTNEDKTVYVRALDALTSTKVKLDTAAQQFADAIKVLSGTGASVVEAARSYAKRFPAKLPDKSVPVGVDEFIKVKKDAGRAERHVEDLTYRLGQFKEAFQCNLASVGERELGEFLDRLKNRQGKPLAPRSRNNFLSTVRSFFRWCVKKKYLPSDWNEFASIETVEDSDGAIEIFSPEELAAFLTHAPDQLVPFFVICGFAGLRSSEFCRLDWSQVGVGGGKYIEVKAKDARKTKQRRLVPIQANLAAWLKDYRKAKGPVWPHGHTYLYEILEGVEAKAGCKWKDNGLRHSYISYRMADVQDAAKVSLEAGNSPQMIFSNYRELVTPEEATRWFSIKPAEGGSEEKVIWLKHEAQPSDTEKLYGDENVEALTAAHKAAKIK